ncbi:MAG: hypothetical protein WAV54_15690 [Acidimicrobiales bacterium]
MASKPILGKVALVRPPYEVAINRGTQHGVKKDDLVTVYEKWTVHDPNTHEEIGAYRRVRFRFKVTVVREKSAMARSFELRSGNVGVMSLTMASVFTPPPTLGAKAITDAAGLEDESTTLIDVGAEVEITPGEGTGK